MVEQLVVHGTPLPSAKTCHYQVQMVKQFLFRALFCCEPHACTPEIRRLSSLLFRALLCSEPHAYTPEIRGLSSLLFGYSFVVSLMLALFCHQPDPPSTKSDGEADSFSWHTSAVDQLPTLRKLECQPVIQLILRHSSDSRIWRG